MIRKFKTRITPFQEERRVYVHLPEHYFDSEERYPVMYMFDGHNLFENETATYGKSWGLEEFMNRYDKPMIMVGVECSHTRRLSEYCPYDVYCWNQQIDGLGESYMDWLVGELKPYIDANYRTIPFRECTGIGGSSMGGLMAYYGVFRYNNWFSKAACLSPSLMICKDQLFEEFRDQMISPDTRVYFSLGTKEVKDPESILRPFAQDLMRRRGSAYVDIVPDGKHHESTWELCNPTYFDFLWK